MQHTKYICISTYELHLTDTDVSISKYLGRWNDWQRCRCHKTHPILFRVIVIALLANSPSYNMHEADFWLIFTKQNYVFLMTVLVIFGHIVRIHVDVLVHNRVI